MAVKVCFLFMRIKKQVLQTDLSSSHFKNCLQGKQSGAQFLRVLLQIICWFKLSQIWDNFFSNLWELNFLNRYIFINERENSNTGHCLKYRNLSA